MIFKKIKRLLNKAETPLADTYIKDFLKSTNYKMNAYEVMAETCVLDYYKANNNLCNAKIKPWEHGFNDECIRCWNQEIELED